ncbi:MAG: hypothetical protein ACJ0A9_02295 [Dehalococcoidia bacterium]
MPRTNKMIHVLEQDEIVIFTTTEELDYQSGVEMSKTWADAILVDFEHDPFDTIGLKSFMKGISDGFITNNLDFMPSVITTLPSNCMTPEEVLYNSWQVRHVLGVGVHGVLHTHARTPEAVKTFISTTRYPFNNLGLNQGLNEGLRGSGGQDFASKIWQMNTDEYLSKADPWPLNPDGELILGLKIEDKFCLEMAPEITKIPGIAFAEWGPGDMGMSFGFPDAHDPPYPKEMDMARDLIKLECDKNGMAFYSSWRDPSMSKKDQIKYAIQVVGARIVMVESMELATFARSLKE